MNIFVVPQVGEFGV